jgi:hypothetical protein
MESDATRCPAVNYPGIRFASPEYDRQKLNFLKLQLISSNLAVLRRIRVFGAFDQDQTANGNLAQAPFIELDAQ